MSECNCNQGRLPCDCDKHGTLERRRGTEVVLVVATAVVAGLYLSAKYLIGG